MIQKETIIWILILFLYKSSVFYLSFDCYFRTSSLHGWIYGKNGTILVHDVTSSALRNTERGGKATSIVGWDWRINLQSKEVWNLFKSNWLDVYTYELLKRGSNISYACSLFCCSRLYHICLTVNVYIFDRCIDCFYYLMKKWQCI